MARTLWKGVLSFGLVTVPIKVHAAVRDFVSPLHQYETGSLLPVRYKKYAGDTGREVKPENIVRGYEYKKGKIISISEQEMESLNLDSEKLIDIDCFVNLTEIPSLLFEKAYFLEADKGGQKGYSLLFNALKKSGKAGIAKVAIRGREYLVAVFSNTKQNLLQLQTLRWQHEVVAPSLTIADSKVNSEELKLAEQLINAKTASFNLLNYVDNYVTGLNAFIEQKLKGKITNKTAKVRTVTAAPDMVAILNASLNTTMAKNTDKKLKKSRKITV